jgi:hypothetical protein
MYPGLLAWGIGFIVQFLVRGSVDREKAAQSDSFLVRHHLGFPPREVLTETGQKLYWVFCACGVVFIASLLLTVIFH